MGKHTLKHKWSGALVGLDPTRTSDIFTDWCAFADQYVAGQERYIAEIGRALELGMSGLRERGKPISCILAAGPSRVGKTLVAKMLADFLFDDPQGMIRLDGQNFSQPHAVESLTGSPHGYVGYDDPPLFTQGRLDAPAFRMRRQEFYMNAGDELKELLNDIEKRREKLLREHNEEASSHKPSHIKSARIGDILDRLHEVEDELRETGCPFYDPEHVAYHSILLIDELGRAHRTLQNILFRILDEGAIDLKSGGTVSFANTFIFLTDNAGDEEITQLLRETGGGRVRVGIQSARSFAQSVQDRDRAIYEITTHALQEKFGTPFLNRVKIIVARPLDRELLRKVLRIEIRKLHERFLRQGCPIIIKITKGVQEFLVSESLDKPEENAALLIGKLESHINEKLVLFRVTGQIEEGDCVMITLKSRARKELRFQKLSRDKKAKKGLIIPPEL